jgi:sugar O-acyltransferase (sialic acid O-acetyltransferase NeuD family)
MTKAIYGVYGASGFGREVMPLIKQEKENCVFIDDAIEAGSEEQVNGYAAMNFDSFMKLDAEERFVTIGIADAKIRQTLTGKCLEAGMKILDIKAHNVDILDEVSIGDGSILCGFVTLTSNIKVGESFQANIYSYIGHDCVIGDYVTFAPRVMCNGNVHIDDGAYIGTGAIIKQGTPKKPIRIGKGAVVAAGSFVNKSVPDGMTVFGSPAIELTRENLKKRNG